MADQMNYTASGPAHGFEKAASTTRTVAEQAVTAGRDLKEKAIEMAGSSSDAIKDQASEFVDAAKDVASQATDKLKQTVDGQKTAGAEYVGSLADTMRRAAKEFDNDLPIAGTYIRKAASQVEGVADSIKTGNFTDLVRGAQSFARRQPTAFLGMAVLAGFGAVRFLKSSADEPTSGSGSRPRSGDNANDRLQPKAPSNGSTADNRGYRDEFTK
jgi:gas vesicle protein